MEIERVVHPDGQAQLSWGSTAHRGGSSQFVLVRPVTRVSKKYTVGDLVAVSIPTNGMFPGEQLYHSLILAGY